MRSHRGEHEAFLDLLDPSLRLLDRPTSPRGEVDFMAAAALVISIASLLPVAAATATAISLVTKIRV